MRRLPEIVLVAASLAALFVLTWLVRTLDVSAAYATRPFWFSEFADWVSLRLPHYQDGPLRTVPIDVLFGALAAGAAAAIVLRLTSRDRIPAGLLLALALVLLAGMALGETLRLGLALDPALAGPEWWRDRRIAEFPLASYAFGGRLALGIGFPAGLVLGVFLAMLRTGVPDGRAHRNGGWLRGLGALALLLAVAELADGMLRSTRLPSSATLSSTTRTLDGFQAHLGRFLALWALGTLGFLFGWLREAGLLTRPAPGRAGRVVDRFRAAAAGMAGSKPAVVGPVDVVRWVLLPAAVVSTAATAGLLAEIRFPYLILLGTVLVWGLTLAGEPGQGQFPRRLVPGAGFAAGFSGAVLLVSGLTTAVLRWPGGPLAPWPAADRVLAPVADGASMAVYGCLTAGALSFLALVGDLRRRQ